MITQKGDGAVNLSTIALIMLAWQLLGNSQKTPQKPSQRPQIGIGDFLNDDAKNILNCMGKLSHPSCSQEDKTNAIFQMMANPAVMNLASNLFGGSNGASSQETTATASDEHVNSEGYRFETPSASSQEFFRPIDNIADTEVKHKLYWFYDNWYIK